MQLRYQIFYRFSGLFDRIWRRGLGFCAVNQEGAARKSLYPSSNRQSDAKESRRSRQANRPLKSLTNRAWAKTERKNTPGEVTGRSRRLPIAATVSAYGFSEERSEATAQHGLSCVVWLPADTFLECGHRGLMSHHPTARYYLLNARS